MIDASTLLDYADILSSDAEDGELTVKLGDSSTSSGYDDGQTIWGLDGFFSSPNDPDDTGACQALYAFDGEEKRIIGTRDNRFATLTGNMKPGDRLIATRGAARFAIKAEAQSITIMTSDDGTKDGRSIYFTLSPTKGLEYSCPWGRMTFGPNGFHVLHSSGARLDLGAIGGMPAPFDSLASYAKLEAGMASVKGGVVSMGTDGGAASESGVTALALLLAQLIAAIGLITPSTPGAAALTSSGVTPAVIAALPTALSPIGKVV